MKDEIKEILNKLRETADYPKLNYSSYDKSYNETIDNVAMIKSFACKQLLDYITNLQEENKILKTRNKILSEDITKDIINCDVIQTVCGIPIEEIPELKLYKSRNEKAIEYIKDNLYYLVDNDDKNLLNILNGGDKE